MSEPVKLGGEGAEAEETEEAEGCRIARRLQSRGGTDLFTFLVLAAADGRWNVFTAAIADLSDMSRKGIEVMLEMPQPSLGWAHIYKAAGLPQSLFSFFIRFLIVARHSATRPDMDRRTSILSAARASQEAKDSPIPDDLWKSVGIS